jgi:uncharacterized protein YbaR (Trm112 family)
MLVELIDRLRCPNLHADCCLVAAVTRAADRQIVEGMLGCPLCGAEYPIREGSVFFGRDDVEPAPTAERSTEDGMIRLAAMLGVNERGGLHVVEGPWSIHAPGLAVRFPEAHLVAISALALEGAGARLRCTGDTIPLAGGCARGVALGRGTRALVDAAVRVLAARGRLVVPEATPMPEGIAVVARDDVWWVGERESGPTAPAPISPRRAAPRTESQ